MGAQVNLKGPDGKSLQKKTSSSGAYEFQDLPAGNYELTVSARQFEPFTTDLNIGNESVEQDVVLFVELREQISIVGNTSFFARSGSSITLTRQQIHNLPDEPGQFLAYLRQLAGVLPGQEMVYVDGFRGNQVLRKHSIESIFINTDPFSAEFPEPARGRIQITTRPGSDTFHGDFNFNFNDEALNARPAFATTRAPLQSRNIEGYLSGPIIRNRWGFSVYGAHWAQDGSQLVNALVPGPDTGFQSFVQSVSSPVRTHDLFVRTNYTAGTAHIFSIDYSRTRDRSKNRGLESGFDLPERAVHAISTDQRLRFSANSELSEKNINEFRFDLNTTDSKTQALNPGPAVLVLDTFHAGGNQESLFSRSNVDYLGVINHLGHTWRNHTFRFGLEIGVVTQQDTDRSNFGGSFTFGADVERDASGAPITDSSGLPRVISPLQLYLRTAMGLPGYRPSLFTINRGQDSVGLRQWNVFWYLQHEWQLAPRMTLTLGLREEFQTLLQNNFDFAPRVGIAWSPRPSNKDFLRAGAGLFYSRVQPEITLETLRLTPGRQEHLLVENPEFFPHPPDDLLRAGRILTASRTKAPDLATPYLVMTTAGYKRQVTEAITASIDYTWQKGTRLLRTRNLSGPALPGSSLDSRPPAFQFESSGKMRRHELALKLQTNFEKIMWFANYSLSSTRSDTDGPYAQPADPLNLSLEFGPDRLDHRHEFFLGGTLTLPWQLTATPFVSVRSGQPFNITTGMDNNGDTVFTDRPALARPGDPGAILTPYGAFKLFPGSADILVGRNSQRGPGEVTLNMGISRLLVAGTVLSVNFDNLINHTNPNGLNGVLTSPFFGRANRSLNPRRIHFSINFTF